jgi:hypothetical protein
MHAQQVWVNHLATEVSLVSNRAGEFTLAPCEHRRVELWDGDLLTATFVDETTGSGVRQESWMVEFEGGIYQEHHIGQVDGGDDDYGGCKKRAAEMKMKRDTMQDGER